MMMNNNNNMMNMMMMMNNKNMINNNPMMKNSNVMNNNQIMSFNQMMNNNNQMNNKNQMINNNQKMNNNQMNNNNQIKMNNNQMMMMNNNQMINNNQMKNNNNQMMMNNNNIMMNNIQMINNNNKMMNNNQMMMMNNNQMKNNNNQMMMMNNNQMINNDNKIMNNNQMMMMNNINNSIYNNNQNSNKLDDNEKQEQLLEIDYMRKKINIYKERIKTLEELIKQKDFEIDNLKNRLSSNFCYNQNMQPINYNPMMMMEQMNNFKNKIENFNNEINDNNNTNKAKNEKKNDIVKNLTLNFSFHETNVQIQCQSNEKMKSIIKRFSTKAALEGDSYYFICKGKKVIDDLTIDENEIFDKDLILVFETAENKKDEAQMKINSDPMINLTFNFQGKYLTIHVSKNSRFSEAVEKFVMKTCIPKKDLHFLYNSSLLQSNENRTIEEIFKGDNNIKIDAINDPEVIGA